jgi:hypothetical protein
VPSAAAYCTTVFAWSRSLLIVGVLACSCAPKKVVTAPAVPVDRFDYVGQSWMRFPARVAGEPTHLILDTGGGVSLLSKQLCAKIGCTPDGTFTGKRMSGQAITVPMARVKSISIAGHEVKNARVAVLDTTSLLHPELGVDGFVGLDLFRDQPFTIDYATQRLVLENDVSLDGRRGRGEVVVVRVDNDGPSTVVFLPLQIGPDAPALQMEVDSGSRDLILHERLMTDLGVDRDGPGVKRVEGRDETAHEYVRFFTKMPRSARVLGTKQVGVAAGATVMFQHIIYDGLVGHAFLSGYTTTYDLARSQMIFAPRS